MSLTALWIIEMEWTFGYENRKPGPSDIARAMMAGDVTTCPEDFREAWLLQVRSPGRNYAAPVLRKYGVSLASLRKELQQELFRIDPSVRPPIPLYDEDEQPARYDPVTSGSRDAILAAVAKLRAKLYGVDPARALEWQKAVKRVMLEMTLAYMETMVCMNAAGIPRSEVETLFGSIDTKGCPEDFIRAWKHDLPYLQKGEFNSIELQLAPVSRKYGVDEADMIDLVKRKMNEWNLSMPAPATQPAFRQEFGALRSNLLDHR